MVDLEWRSGVAAKDWESIAKKEKIDGMGLELRKLDETVRAIRDEMTYFRGRESAIRDSNERTNERVAFISITSLLICKVSLQANGVAPPSFSAIPSAPAHLYLLYGVTRGGTARSTPPAIETLGSSPKQRQLAGLEKEANQQEAAAARQPSPRPSPGKNATRTSAGVLDPMAGRVPQAALRAASHPSFLLTFVSLLAVLPAARIGCHAWGHDGHAFTCAIAQALLTDEAAAAVAALLPAMARGSLPAVCSWADVIAHTKGWGWSSPLHYIDTPDFACSYDERRDCAFAHHPGVCVANAIINYTSQLLTYSPHSSSQPNYYSRRSFPPSSPQVTTLLKPAGLPTSPHQRSFLLRGVDEAEAAVLGGAEEEGEGREGVAEGGEGEEEMVQVVRRVVQVVRGVVRDGARKAAHASILAAAVPARQKEAVDVAFESTQKLPARQQQEAVEVGSIKRYNLTEALMFLAHFAGDIHQPLHVGFTSDLGGNRVHVTWFKRKTNLHAVWDSFIIASAIHLRYNGSSTAMLHHIAHQLASDWRPLIPAWASCLEDNRSYAAAAAAAEAALAVSPAEAAACPAVYAMESAKDACKWAYHNATPGAVLGDEYFSSRLPIVEMRIAMGGVRLARILNRIFAPLRAVL
ncbi:unnamed protein product [Closterium sp. NIES-53]